MYINEKYDSHFVYIPEDISFNINSFAEMISCLSIKKGRDFEEIKSEIKKHSQIMNFEQDVSKIECQLSNIVSMMYILLYLNNIKFKEITIFGFNVFRRDESYSSFKYRNIIKDIVNSECKTASEYYVSFRYRISQLQCKNNKDNFKYKVGLAINELTKYLTCIGFDYSPLSEHVYLMLASYSLRRAKNIKVLPNHISLVKDTYRVPLLKI